MLGRAHATATAIGCDAVESARTADRGEAILVAWRTSGVVFRGVYTTDMDDNTMQHGLQPEQWLPTFEKGEKRANSLGSGAFRFIRTRSSIRRELKRQCHR